MNVKNDRPSPAERPLIVALAQARVDPRHDHLDALLDD